MPQSAPNDSSLATAASFGLAKDLSAKQVRVCAICKRSEVKELLVPVASLRSVIVDQIRKLHPDLRAEDYICQGEIYRARSSYVEGLLQDERGEVTALERDVLAALAMHEISSEHPQTSGTARGLTFGERLSDKLAEYGGSWRFIGVFAGLLVVWIAINSVVVLTTRFDPYPFILLNLILSCVAALQAPVIMMSQNRQEAKDRERAEYDYRINLKAELEIRHLHEKIDHLLKHQWERLVEIQQLQIEILSELVGGRYDGENDS
jgi:uncharacterized membrane protein